jgi:hypothetical protein
VQAATSTTDYYDQFSACMEGGPIGSTPPCLNVDWLQAQVVDVSIESTPMQAVAVPVGPTSSN